RSLQRIRSMAIRPIKNKFQVDVAVTVAGKLHRVRETLSSYDAAKIREAEIKLGLMKHGKVPPKADEKVETAPKEFTLRFCVEGCNRAHWLGQARSARGLYLNALTMLEFTGDDYDVRKVDFQWVENYKEWLRGPRKLNG